MTDLQIVQSLRRPRPAIKVLTVFGTRPEVIKLAPVLRVLGASEDRFRSIPVASSQHGDLLWPFIARFGLRVDHDLAAMRPGQSLNLLCARIMAALHPILEAEAPDLVLVQGDTTTALAGALAGYYRRIPVGHVEAGLRSGNADSPFPEEMNRRVITSLARFHFAATAHNVASLRAEGVPESRIVLTGNPVVDALHWVLGHCAPSDALRALLDRLHGRRVVVLTTHRRESFGAVMGENLAVLRRFVERHEDVALVFPVHPNPNVRAAADAVLAGAPRVHLLDPLDYPDFIHLLAGAWLIVSDSGGVQEEAPSLGKPLLVLRENTERPEAIACGVARLVGGAPARLAALLEEAAGDAPWLRRVQVLDNPYGHGDSGARIVAAIERFLSPEPVLPAEPESVP